MKRNNLWRIIWIVGIYAVLVSILYLVVLYKVEWEDKDLNKYLYFYNCSNELCTSYQEPDNYYGSILCENEICPFITEKQDNILILSDGNKSFIYNYIDGKIINNKYNNYHFINYNYYIVTDENNKQGVIDNNNQVVVDFNYDKIIDYKNGYVAYKQDGYVGINNDSNSIHIEAKYEDVVLINSSIYAYRENNAYYIAAYGVELPISNTTYDYIYAGNGLILAARNNQIDILDENLTTKLLMKIDSYYSYTKEKERNSLNIYIKNDFLYFSVYAGDGNYINYSYDIRNGKIYT